MPEHPPAKAQATTSADARNDSGQWRRRGEGIHNDDSSRKDDRATRRIGSARREARYGQHRRCRAAWHAPSEESTSKGSARTVSRIFSRRAPSCKQTFSTTTGEDATKGGCCKQARAATQPRSTRSIERAHARSFAANNKRNALACNAKPQTQSTPRLTHRAPDDERRQVLQRHAEHRPHAQRRVAELGLNWKKQAPQ